jgi:glutamate synthase (NADPH/NADH) large chain
MVGRPDPDPVLAGLSAVAPPPDPQGPAHLGRPVVETGEAREVHQFATLAGYGAEAINPYLAFDTIDDMLPKLAEDVSRDEAVKRYIKAVGKGLLKVMSKMGISTYQSYCGAQIFDAVGLRQAFVDRTSPARHAG